jgi:hypothetical protein
VNGDDPDPTCINETVHTITAGAYHAVMSYAFQASGPVIADHRARLLEAVRVTPVAGVTTPFGSEATTGELLHLALLTYMRYISDAGQRLGDLNGAWARSGHHIAVASAHLKTQYVLGVPFGIFPSDLPLDVQGGQFHVHDLVTGDLSWETYKLWAYTASAYEHYLWQEIAGLEAVSAVRGLQYATGVEHEAGTRGGVCRRGRGRTDRRGGGLGPLPLSCRRWSPRSGARGLATRRCR